MNTAHLVLGPLVRYVDEHRATLWFETDAPCVITVTLDGGTNRSSETTWGLHGHHYAIVSLEDLPADSVIDYTVDANGISVWPLGTARARLRTLCADGPVTLAFGSCRRGDDYSEQSVNRIGADALAALGAQIREQNPSEWPTVLVFLGDQVYADDPSPSIVERLRARRTSGDGPAGARNSDAADEICDFEEYSWLYHESWGAEPVRDLLATIPSCMILDDHDLRDDWNSSADWRREIETKSWWLDRVVGAFSSYWVYQHLGNLSPHELEEDPLYAAVRGAESDSDRAKLLAEFALRADREPDSARWSYHRDFGRTRLIMIDSRCSRDLDPGRRLMVDDAEWAWVRERALESDVDHLLLGSSLPFLMLPGLHNVEQWDEAVAQGSRGRFASKLGEKLRIALDLEHWAAFGKSFDAMVTLATETVRGPKPPASVLWLSGDVHCSYVAKADFGAEAGHTATYQLTMSPFRNPLNRPIRIVNRLATKPAVVKLLAAIARSAYVTPTTTQWHTEAGPWFENGVMLLTTIARSANLQVCHAHIDEDGTQRLTSTAAMPLTPTA